MRRLGYRTVDMLVDRLADPAGGPALSSATPAEMQARLAGRPPEAGQSFDDLLSELESDVLAFTSRCEHPRYFAFVPAAGTWPGALADFIASACNVYTGSWMEAAGPSQVELTVLRWFCDWVGYPESAAGVLLNGGSAANMTALACAREALLGPMTDRATAYVSDQAHSSLARAARVLGFRPNQVRVLPVDDRYRLRVDALTGAMEADLEAGREPLFVSASAGSTNTGAVDPLEDVADVCAEHGAWLHVDGAYGGFAALTERGRAALAGIERADSMTLDPHKWLYQPFECGCLLVRDGERLRRAFEITPDYLKDARIREGEVNFSDMGLQLTRSFRALKIWLSIKFFGVRAFTAAIDRCLDLAAEAERRIEASPELELLSPAALGVVGFRRLFGGGRDEAELDALNAELVNSMAAGGDALISSTRLEGRYAMRLCILNHTSGPEDVAAVLDWLEQHDVATQPERAPVHAYRRHESVAQALPASGPPSPSHPETRPDLDAIRSLPLFAGLSEERLESIRELAVEESVESGRTIVRQWDAGSDFYILVDGRAEVSLGGEPVGELGPGDFFGEVAALEWGAGFSYGRTASVGATSGVRLVRLSSDALAAVVADCPTVGERVRQARRARLART